MRTGNLFSYVIAEEMSLMATYSAYNEIVDLGFKNAVIRTFVLEDPAEKELNTLKKVFGVSVDVFFNQNDFSLTSAGTQMLDLILGFMAKYPALKLEIATHTDNTGMPAASMLLSQKRAEAMINYLIVNGVSSLRLIPKGFGGTKPLVPNMYEADRKLNRRVEFTIMRLL
jgi:outer membrane protein OmpA-like peptidoglycan-associated protein